MKHSKGPQTDDGLTMNVQSYLIRQLFVAERAHPLLLRLEMPAHVLVVGVLRHVQETEPAPEHLRIINELIFALVGFVVFIALEREPTELAVPHVEDSEVDFRSLSSLVQAGVLGDSGVCCVFLAACGADVAVII